MAVCPTGAPSLGGLTVALAWVAATAAPAGLVINEILPDPPGPDAGSEFVELLNASADTVDLTGVAFQFANGAEDPRWTTRWSAPGGRLGPGEFLLLADAGWPGDPPADATAALALQNGPDAVRLVRGDAVLDLVGYGEPLHSDLAEGAPARPEPGLALARRPDGRDLGDNAGDFAAAPPTPGRPNFTDWLLVVVAVVLEPPSLPRPGEPLAVEVTLGNRGLEAWPETPATLEAGLWDQPVTVPACAADAETTVTWTSYPARAGRWDLRLRLPVPAAGGDLDLDLDLGAVQVGPGDLVINEVMPAPRHSTGEWVELRAGNAGSVRLGDYRLRDEDGPWRTLPDLVLGAGKLLLLAQDPGALAAVPPGSDDLGDRCRGGAAAVALSPWPGLNNTPAAGRTFPDRVWLADSLGVVDHTVYPELPSGRSWERIAWAPVHPLGANWGVCTAQAGATPGCRNSLDPPGTAAAGLAVDPNVLDPSAGASVLHLRFTLEDAEEAWRLRGFDLWGAPVRDFGGDALGPGPRDLPWDGADDGGRPLPRGAYILVLETLDARGLTGRRVRAVAVVR